jgi:carbon-monoxide dehydrogenase large subunit
MLGIEPSRVRMWRSDAGGGFGVRGELYPEDVLVALLARECGCPVKWIEDRAEHLVAANHSRDQRHVLSAAFSSEGDLLGLRAEIWHNNGAYVRTHGLTVPELTASMLPGPYRMDAFEARVHVVVTNKTPCGTYRAPGRYETTFARERLLDASAVELGLDPVELRRRNLLRPDELPLARGLRALGTDVVLDPGDYPGLLEEAIRVAGYEQWRREATEAADAGRLVGTGCAVFLEKSGLGPYEQATARISPTGALQVAAGGTSLGQGIETVLAQIAADHFGVPTASVSVVAGDTGLVEDGVGSWASRSTVVGGAAVDIAAARLADLSREAAAELLEADPGDIRLSGGHAFVAGTPGRSVTLADVAVSRAGEAGRGSAGTGLEASGRFEVDHMTYPYGVHFAQVEVDAETGQVTVLRYFVAYEVGRAVNPTNVEGQLVGGAVQGLGGALLEEVVYGPDGQPFTASLIDYMLPFATEAPEVGTLVSERFPATTNPLGLRGAGEGGLTACGAAVASAVGAAVGQLEGPRRLPITPRDVWALLAAGTPGSPTGASADGAAPVGTSAPGVSAS